MIPVQGEPTCTCAECAWWRATSTSFLQPSADLSKTFFFHSVWITQERRVGKHPTIPPSYVKFCCNAKNANHQPQKICWIAPAKTSAMQEKGCCLWNWIYSASFPNSRISNKGSSGGARHILIWGTTLFTIFAHLGFCFISVWCGKR